jgi:hypothetical protein
MSFTIGKLRKINFLNKNSFNDYRVCCKSSSNLLKLIGIDVDFKKELEQFEGTFERDEIVNS